MMRVAMLSCNTGEGHNSTAKAVQQVLKDRGVTCDLIDVLACLSPKFSKFLCNWHVRIYKYGPKLFDMGYRVCERTDPEPGETTPLYELLTLGTKKLYQQIVEGQYDILLCVHVFSAMMVTELRKNDQIRIPCYFVSTDYTCHPFVGCCNMDGYFIPSADLADEFLTVGIPGNRLIPSGIPVRQDFYKAPDREKARAMLQLPADETVLLLICGSMGCGPMKEIAETLVERLPENATVVAICGRNERLYESMKEIGNPKLRPVGFTTEMPAYMDAADLVITKPGGLSSTEAANKHLPMVFINTVGGCESRNFNYFVARGYAIGSSDPEEMLEQALLLAKYPVQLSRMRRNLSEDFAVNSAELIADRIMETAPQPSAVV